MYRPVIPQPIRYPFFADVKTIGLCALLALCATCRMGTLIPADTEDRGVRQSAEGGSDQSADRRDCPAYGVHEGVFPGVTPEHRNAAFWLDRMGERADQIVLSIDDIDRHNAAVGHSGRGHRSRWNLLVPHDPADLEKSLTARVNAVRPHLQNGHYVDSSQKPLSSSRIGDVTRSFGKTRAPEDTRFHMAVDPVQIRCIPLDEKLFVADSGAAFDRNACSRMASQEVFEVLGESTTGMYLIRTPYALGWISPNAPISPPLPGHLRWAVGPGPARMSPHSLRVVCDGDSLELAPWTFVKDIPDTNRILIARTSGFCKAKRPDGLEPVHRPLTRRALFRDAFSLLDSDYGYGGEDGGRDCSRFIMDLLEGFGLTLPRVSAWQAEAGSYAIDVDGTKTPEQKLHYLDRASTEGIVLLYFPGHIMLYLGRNEHGVPMAIHSLGEYARPCPGGKDTVFRVKSVVVTDLNVGRDSGRKSFLERLTRLVVLSPTSHRHDNSEVHLREAAFPRIPNRCIDSQDMRIFVSPRRPRNKFSTRIIATGTIRDAPLRLQIRDPDGTLLFPETRTSQGPPFSYIATVTPDKPGIWTASLGDGVHVVACDTFQVSAHRHRPPERKSGDPYWSNRWKWEQDTENYFSTFVAHLFRLPPSNGSSWSSLTELISDPERNLLYNHFDENEDVELTLRPDCADLPYVLRAYFAWKNALPFGVRRCTRGREGVVPTCGELITNLIPCELPEPDLHQPHMPFEYFARVPLAWNAHSGSLRTHPDDDETDFYPVALTRDALTPGTVFADPFGHIFIVTHWTPQSAGGFGVLMTADGQPDGTIGLRQFSRGAFSFDPQTHSVGSGFKRFRPLISRRETTVTPNGELERMDVVESLTHRQLSRSRFFVPWSQTAYSETVQHFYDTMERLINPDPLSPDLILWQRIDVFFENTERRVIAVDNGVQFMTRRNWQPIEMPEGHDIFETQGPWEDYSTPSRDMRLLKVMDVLMSLPDEVLSAPDRFGVSSPEEATALSADLTSRLNAQLETRRIEYINSAGHTVSLTLKEIMNRRMALEVAYNPNDCVETRWGADAGSEEAATCNRFAPDDQKTRMKEYRHWFQDRQRPGR